jgi:hypothetical protein
MSVLRIEAYAAAMGLSVQKVRDQLSVGLCDVTPRDVRPYRWTQADVDRHWATITLPEARKRHRKYVAAKVSASVASQPVTVQHRRTA